MKTALLGMPRPVGLRPSAGGAAVLLALCLGAGGCGAPCTSYCRKLLGCAPTGSLSCESQQDCEARCAEADYEDRTGDFAAGAGCVANPNFSCSDLVKGACPAPEAPGALPAVEVCHAIGKNFSFPVYPGSPWPLCTADPGSFGGAACDTDFSGG